MPTKQTTATEKEQLLSEKKLLEDLEEFRKKSKAWNEEFYFEKPANIDIVKSTDSKDKDGNITKYGKLLVRIKFEKQRKGFFISSEIIADKLLDFIDNNKDLIIKLSQYIDLVNDGAEAIAVNKGAPKKYKIL